MSWPQPPEVLALLADVGAAGDRDAQMRYGFAFSHDPLAGLRALPLARERERNELARPERTKAKVIELLFVVREHHRASFEIEPCDLIHIDRGKDESPED